MVTRHDSNKARKHRHVRVRGKISGTAERPRLRLADGNPVMLEVNKFPEKFFFLFNEDLNNASLYETIHKKTGIVFTRSSKLLEIVFANYQESRYLGVSKGHPLLSIKSIVQDDSGENRHLSHQLCIADKFKLMV